MRAEEEWIEQSKPGACSTWRGRSSRPAGFQPFSHTCVPTGYSFLFGTFCAPTSCTVNFVARLLQAEALALSSHRKSQERGMGVMNLADPQSKFTGRDIHPGRHFQGVRMRFMKRTNHNRYPF